MNASATAGAARDGDLPAHVLDLIRHDHERIEPRLGEYRAVLERQGASEIWHKHGTFLDHLLGVWRILAAWQQPTDVCRLGLMHSIYSNSFVRMKLFDAEHASERAAVQQLIGVDAEQLVHTFCEIRRDQLLGIGPDVPADGIEIGLYRVGGKVRLSRRELGIFLVVTMADYAEQSFSWQDRLFAGGADQAATGGGPRALWPGDNRPGLWMGLNARVGRRAAACAVEPLPPVFARCSVELAPDVEREARDLYWQAVCDGGPDADPARVEDLLRAAAVRNPFIAEPHVLLAQCHLNRRHWDDAAAEAKLALDVLAAWGTSWDKRLSWDAWVAWSRVLLKGAVERVWPETAFGIISLGEVRRSA